MSHSRSLRQDIACFLSFGLVPPKTRQSIPPTQIFGIYPKRKGESLKQAEFLMESHDLVRSSAV